MGCWASLFVQVVEELLLELCAFLVDAFERGCVGSLVSQFGVEVDEGGKIFREESVSHGRVASAEWNSPPATAWARCH